TEQVHGQATELTRRGHEVTVVQPRLVHVPRIVDGDDLPDRNFEIVQVARAWPFYLNGSETLISVGATMRRDLDRLFARRSFDVLHVHNPIGLTPPIAAAVRSQAKA